MESIEGILFNKILISSLLAWVIAQFLKVIITLVLTKKIDFAKFIEPGGMPSAHSATVSALATAVGEVNGYDSVVFGISFIYALVVMYDASGVRRAAGKQAKVLNKIIEELKIKDLHMEERLKELLGHTPIEVFVGAVLGIWIALLYL